MTERERALREALHGLRVAVGAYAARHKVDRCDCAACEKTRGMMALADRVLATVSDDRVE